MTPCGWLCVRPTAPSPSPPPLSALRASLHARGAVVIDPSIAKAVASTTHTAEARTQGAQARNENENENSFANEVEERKWKKKVRVRLPIVIKESKKESEECEMRRTTGHKGSVTNKQRGKVTSVRVPVLQRLPCQLT